MKKLYGSSASSWWACSGSLDFVSGKNIYQDRSLADKGDRFHAFCEDFLKLYALPESKNARRSKPKTYKELIKFLEEVTRYKFKNKDERFEFIKWGESVYNRIAADIEIYGPNYRLEIESSYKEKINKDWELSVRADMILFAPGIVIVYDIKTGWVEVEAFENKQLEATAHILHKQGKIKKNCEILGVIIQPPLKIIDPSLIEIDPNYFAKVRVIVENKNKKLIIGSQCSYCNFADVCPTFEAEWKKFLNPTYRDQKINRPDKWKDILEVAKPLIKQLQSIQSTALQAMKDGVEIPGFKLDARNARRSWNHKMHASSLAKFLKVKNSDVIDTKLENPAQVEKLIKTEEQKERFSLVVTQPVFFNYKKDKGGLDIFEKSKGRSKKDESSKQVTKKKVSKNKKNEIDFKKPKRKVQVKTKKKGGHK